MKHTAFKVEGKEVIITRESILSAMREYDEHYRRTANDSGRNYVVKHNGKLYPPKHLLSLAIQKPRGSFHGGKAKTAANAVFQDLGFEIVVVGNRGGTGTRSRPVKYDQAKMDAPVPDVQDLIERLFSQKWTNLHANYRNLEDGQFPGAECVNRLRQLG